MIESDACLGPCQTSPARWSGRRSLRFCALILIGERTTNRSAFLDPVIDDRPAEQGCHANELQHKKQGFDHGSAFLSPESLRLN